MRSYQPMCLCNDRKYKFILCTTGAANKRTINHYLFIIVVSVVPVLKRGVIATKVAKGLLLHTGAPN